MKSRETASRIEDDSVDPTQFRSPISGWRPAETRSVDDQGGVAKDRPVSGPPHISAERPVSSSYRGRGMMHSVGCDHANFGLNTPVNLANRKKVCSNDLETLNRWAGGKPTLLIN
jgi:hypothetical protein